MEYSKLGIAFVSESVPNRKEIESLLQDKEDELLEKAKNELDAWLESMGLESVMGVVRRISDVLPTDRG